MAEITITKVLIRDPGMEIAKMNLYGQMVVSESRPPKTVLFETSVSRGENLGDWRELIRRGDNATTDMSGYNVVQTADVGAFGQWQNPKYATRPDMIVRYKGCTYDFTVRYGLLAWQADSAMLAARRAASEQFVKRSLERLAPVNGLQFLGELRDTIKLVTNPLGAVVKLANRLKKRGLSKVVQNSAEAIAELRLQWAFGVKPLIDDLDGGLQALGKIRLGGGTFVMVKGKGQVEGSAMQVLTDTTRPIRTTMQNVSVAACAVRGVIDLPNIDSDGGFAYSILGFNKYNIPRTVWELVPFSFLADYFLTIGKTLDAIALITSGGLRWHNVTTRKYRTFTLTEEIVDTGGFKGVMGTGAKCVIEESEVVRTREPPEMRLIWYPTDVSEKSVKNAQKVANMAALATLALGRVLRQR